MGSPLQRMEQTPRNSVLRLREADLTDRDGYVAADDAAVLAGAVARDMVATRSLEEGEAVAIRALLRASDLGWGAIYRPKGEIYHISQSVHPQSGKLPKTLEPQLAPRLLDGIRRVGGCDDQDLSPRLKGASLLVRLESEFESNPALLLLGRHGPHVGGEVALRSVEAIADVCSASLKNLELIERLRSEISIDFLTNCYNRRAFEEHLNVELIRAKRYERPLCLLLMDLDEFKEINDVLGHQAGDYVLQRVGETLRAAFRTTDRVCRFGGDEFAVIFPETPKDEVLRLAERLRKHIRALFPDKVIPSPLTSSIGVAAYPLDARRGEDLVKVADQAMYRAKESGRNKVIPA